MVVAGEEWTRDQVVAFLAQQGHRIEPATWSAYVARGRAPAAKRHVGRTPLWDPQAVRDWFGARRGKGWRANDETAPSPPPPPERERR